MTFNPDIAREIRLQERHSATGDRRWRASCPGDYDGYGATAEEAIADLIRINDQRRTGEASVG